MKVISIGTDRRMFEDNSAVRRRNIEYGKFFEETHIIVFSTKSLKLEAKGLKIGENVWVYPTNSKNKLFYVFDAFRISKTIIHNSKFIIQNFVVSCQDPFETGLVGALIKLFFNIPLQIQIHTDLMNKYFWRSSVLNKLRFLIAEFVIRYSDRIRAVSSRIRKSIEQFSKEIDVLPIKMEIKTESEEEITKPFPFTLLMVCRLEKEKNIEVVLRAIKNLNNKNIGLCLVGDGSEKNNIQKMAENMGILGQIYFAGWQNNIAPYYKIADIFVSSSFYEGYGVSTVEAAYFGKPLVLSETGVAEDIYKNNDSALICDALDTECFAKNILRLFEDKNLVGRLGGNAKRDTEEHIKNNDNYFEKYADSVKKTALNFKERSFFGRIFYFKITIFNSFMILRYLICGTVSAGILVGSLYVFTDIVGIWYLYSSVLAFFLSLIASFVLQKFVVFKDMETNGVHNQFSKFFIAAVLSLISNTAIMFVCVDVLGIWYILSQIITGALVMFQNFALYKFFIFNKNKV